MTKRPIVLVDMDGVLADFDGATNDFLQRNHPDITIAKRRNFYYSHDYLDADHQKVINRLHASQNFFRNLPLIEGAREGWQKIIDLDYQPRICSSPLHTNQWCQEEKLDWIEQHFGAEARKNAIITKDKHTVDGIALIDDRPEVRDTDAASWQHIVFDQPYNHEIDTKLRLKGWNDPRLAALLAQCAKDASRNSSSPLL